MKSRWNKRCLGDFFRIKHGYAFKGKHFVPEGELVLLTPGNFNAEGGLKLKGAKEKYYDGEFPAEFLLNRNDFLLAMTDLTQNAPILGSPLIVPESDRYLHNQRLGKLTDLNGGEIDIRFLFYLFNSESVRSQIKGSATGATVKHTAPERIYKVQVEVPSLPTQRRIAGILSAYDDLIENNLRRIRILEEMAQSLYREWFVHFRYPGHESVPLVDSPLGPIPDGWEVNKVKDACQLTMGQSPKSEFYNDEGDGTPFHQGVTNFGDHFPTDRLFCTIDKRMAETGDILFSVRAPVGRINVADKRIVIGRGVSAIRDLSGHQDFLYFQLKQIFQEEDSIGNGAIFNAVTKSDMQGIDLLTPPERIVERFQQTASPIFQSIKNLTSRNQTLRQTRDLLLPKLLSGGSA
jgi:type I restriction enzyme S subunit